MTTSYRSVEHFMADNRITLPTKEEWRTTPYLLGEINGLPGSRGYLVATNGILCYILQPNGTLFLGHLAFFITDKKERVQVDPETKLITTKAPTRRSSIDDLIGSLI